MNIEVAVTSEYTKRAGPGCVILDSYPEVKQIRLIVRLFRSDTRLY